MQNLRSNQTRAVNILLKFKILVVLATALLGQACASQSKCTDAYSCELAARQQAQRRQNVYRASQMLAPFVANPMGTNPIPGPTYQQNQYQAPVYQRHPAQDCAPFCLNNPAGGW